MEPVYIILKYLCNIFAERYYRVLMQQINLHISFKNERERYRIGRTNERPQGQIHSWEHLLSSV